MLFICSHKTCPEYVEPCIFSMDDMNHAIGRTTVCPIGEDEDAMEIDELMTFFCLIVGSRTYDNYETFSKIVDKALSSKQNQEIIIVSGGAKGADQMAERYAKEHGYHLIVIEADWDNFGKKAGPIRNEQMHRFISHFPNRGALAFWDGKSRGTATNFKLAEKYGNQIRVYNYIENRFAVHS